MPRIQALGLLVLLAFASYFPLISRSGVTEQDSVRIEWSLIRGMQTGRGLDLETPVYGRLKNPGYYEMFFALYPRALGVARIASVMNAISFASMVVAVGAVYVGLAAVAGSSVAFDSAVLLVFVPIVWDMAGYGHPDAPAFALFCLGWLCSIRASQEGRRWPWSASAIVLIGVASWIRGEMLLALPLIFVTALVTAGQWRLAIARSSPIILLSFALYRLLMIPAERIAVSESSSFSEYVLATMARNNRLSELMSGVAYWVIGVGPLLCLLAATGLVMAVRAKQYRLLLITLCWIVPAGLFFLPNPRPARHFLLTAPGLTLLAAHAMAARPIRRRWVGLVVVVVAGYVVSAAVSRLVVANYSWHYAPETGRRTSLAVPMGGMLSHRRATNELMDRIRADAERLAERRDSPIFVIGTDATLRLACTLAERDPHARWSVTRVGTVDLIEVRTTWNTFVLSIDRENVPITALLHEVEQSGKFGGFQFFQFPTDAATDDPFVLPPGLRPLAG